MANAPWSLMASGLRLHVRLTPRGGRDAVDGIETMSDGHVVLKCRVRSAPTEGEANAALVMLIAKTLGVARSAVVISAGATARIKTLRIDGNPQELEQRLMTLAAKAP